ncbi:Universal stress protein A-like protein [Ananas comosus]|uniref:Universal stress protein A-like protein n=1 Tax=Ananas comosus TaxID=4615 RepID=A0A199UWD9_ANACO|nr:Universal stress protein A-like protein [Ananas comosus]
MAAAERGDGRRVGAALDFSRCSKAALRWAAENVLRAGDHLVVVHVQKEARSDLGESLLWQDTGSPYIPLSELSEAGTAKKYGVKVDAETLDILNTISKEKEVQVIMKIYWGDAREKICEAINNIPLSYLIIGNRGFSKIKRILLGSVSEYVVSNATCPVTVIKSFDQEG